MNALMFAQHVRSGRKLRTMNPEAGQDGVALPDNFALIEANIWQQIVGFISHGLPRTKLIVEIADANPFVYITDLSFKNTYASRLVHRAVRGMLESGVFDMWRQWFEMHQEIALKAQVVEEGQ